MFWRFKECNGSFSGLPKYGHWSSVWSSARPSHLNNSSCIVIEREWLLATEAICNNYLGQNNQIYVQYTWNNSLRLQFKGLPNFKVHPNMIHVITIHVEAILTGAPAKVQSHDEFCIGLSWRSHTMNYYQTKRSHMEILPRKQQLHHAFILVQVQFFFDNQNGSCCLWTRSVLLSQVKSFCPKQLLHNFSSSYKAVRTLLWLVWLLLSLTKSYKWRVQEIAHVKWQEIE